MNNTALTLSSPKNRVSASATLSTHDPYWARLDVKQIIHDKIRMQVADHISKNSVVERIGEEFVTYSLEVYVHTAEELIELINRQAIDLARRLDIVAQFPR